MAQNLKERFEKAASENLKEIAIQHKKDHEWIDVSYEDLINGVRSLSAFLVEEKIGKNDKVAILIENRPEWPIVFFSIVSAGAVTIPINPESSREEIENILKDSECKYAFASEDFLSLMEEVSRKCPLIEKVVSVDSDVFSSAVKKPSRQGEGAQIDSSDLACILYTSGTTAEPKGVMLSHGNLLANCDSINRTALITEKDAVISVLPLHHAYPLTVTMLLPLLYGRRIVYPGTMRGEAVLEAIRETGATVFIAVPQIFYSFYQKIEEGLKKIPFPFNLLFKFIINSLYKIRAKTGINLSRYLLYGIHKRFGRSMRVFGSGGAKLDENVARSLFKYGFTILEGYGLTETSPVLTFNPLARPKIGSTGIALPGVELKIADKNEEGIGEVIARGANIMKGYYKKEDLTSGVIKNGWFHTGDLGYIDGEGYLFLTGRLKELIVLSSGVNVYPEEVEDAYTKGAPVKEMCVFEVPLKRGAEEVLALWGIVVPDLEFFKKYGEINLKAVIKERFDNVSRTLPGPMRLMGFSITLNELPRTLLGKIKRFAVKEIYASKVIEGEPVPEEKKLSEEDLELMGKELYKRIAGYLKKQTGIKKTITPPDLLELDLGIDSLGRIELASGLEKLLGMEIKDEVVGKAFTVKDLAENLEAFLSRAAETYPEYKEEAFVPGKWKEILQGLPKEENLEKIDMNPGWVAWLACFVFTCMLKAYFKPFFSLKVEGKENFPEKGPYILYVNHTSYFDGLLIGASLPRFPRLDLFFIGFRPYFEVPIIRSLVKVGRIIPLDFSSHFLEALKSSYYVLRNGKNLCLFPEGLRTLDGNIGEFKKGFGILVKETSPKLVPIVIEGAFQAWPRTSKFPRRHPIKVRFGEALDPEKLEKEGLEMGARDSYEAICLAARKALIELQSQAREV